MPKYLFRGSFSTEGLRGLLQEGGSKRREMVAQLLKDMGGTLEAYYLAFGGEDFFIIFDLPDNVTTTAVSLAANASGAIKGSVTVLLTPEEVDQAVQKTVNYRPSGQ